MTDGGLRVPLPTWLLQYRREWLGPDVIAGVTLAAYAVPVSMAYSSLAGLPPQTGIYCYLLGGLGYALCGTSRQWARSSSSVAVLRAARLSRPQW